MPFDPVTMIVSMIAIGLVLTVMMSGVEVFLEGKQRWAGMVAVSLGLLAWLASFGFLLNYIIDRTLHS